MSDDPGRRTILFGGAAVAVGMGGLNPPPLNAPPAGQPGIGVQPGTSPGVFFGHLVVVFGPTGSTTGVFVYQPGTTPGPGNPPVESMTESTTDPFGNAVQPGVVSYSSPTTYSQLHNADVDFVFGGIHWRATVAALNDLVISDITNNVNLFIAKTGPTVTVTPNDPNLPNNTETWHTPTLTGFGNNGTNLIWKFTLQSDGMVAFNGEMAATGAYTAGTAIFTLPAGYRPAATIDVNVTVATAGGIVAGQFNVTTAGVVSFNANLALNNVIVSNGEGYRLTA